MSDKQGRQWPDKNQHGGGLQPGQDFEDLYTVKPDSHQDAGGADISPNSSDRGREHTRGN